MLQKQMRWQENKGLGYVNHFDSLEERPTKWVGERGNDFVNVSSPLCDYVSIPQSKKEIENEANMAYGKKSGETLNATGSSKPTEPAVKCVNVTDVFASCADEVIIEDWDENDDLPASSDLKLKTLIDKPFVPIKITKPDECVASKQLNVSVLQKSTLFVPAVK